MAGLRHEPTVSLPTAPGQPTLDMTKHAQLEQVRTMLVGPEQAELARLRERIAELEALVPRLAQAEDVMVEEFEHVAERLGKVEATLVATEGRTSAVGEVLVDAVSTTQRVPGALGEALKPDIEHAVHSSARVDSSVLAEALYPVMGPAMRKMIADLFSINSVTKGQTFVVQQVLLIDRRSGLLLASRSIDGDASEDSIVVSGMLDAIQHFVQDAFDKPNHDGLQDLRVGDTSVLVEWSPHAALASVVTGIPTSDYRLHAAETLEQLHAEFGPALASFDGSTSGLERIQTPLAPLFSRRHSHPPLAQRSSSKALVGLALVIAAIVITVLIWMT